MTGARAGMQGHLSMAAVSAVTLYLCCAFVPQSTAWNIGSTTLLQNPVGLRASSVPALRNGNLRLLSLPKARFPSISALRMAISDEARISTSGGAGGFFT
jgi:hypothetical protein